MRFSLLELVKVCLFCFNQVIIEGFEQVIVLFGKIRCNFFCMFFIKYN